MGDPVQAVVEAIEASEETVVFTGAGISTASGLPDFRGDSGIWEDLQPADFTVDALETRPRSFWESWVELHEAFFEDAEATPNAAHQSLGRMVREGVISAVLTQNADGLHQDAGTPADSVVEVHGNARTVTCRDCGRTESVTQTVSRIRGGANPPRCVECDGDLEPDAVLFGERLPPDAFRRARRLAAGSDLFIVVGSSLTVEPAASLPALATETGAILVIDNFDPTPHDGLADHRFEVPAEEFVPALESGLGSN